MLRYTCSFDLSTSNVGIALFDNTNKLVELEHLTLKHKKDHNDSERELYKAEVFYDYMKNYKEYIFNNYNGVVDRVFIEDPLGGSNNAFTVAKLHSFNGMGRYILYKIFGVIPEKITVHESRKIFCPEFISEKKVKGEIKKVLSFPTNIDKKEYIFKKVSNLHPEIQWRYDKNNNLSKINYDMSDAYCVGYAGLNKNK